MSEEFDATQFNMEIISAAQCLHPDKPEELASRNLIPYFQDLGMNDENIVPGGLREYTAEVMRILDMNPTIANLKTMLELPEVETTLRSAIKAATSAYEANKATAMPDMSNMQGVSEDVIQKLTQLAQAEQKQTDARHFADNLTPPEEPVQEESAPEEETPPQEEPVIKPLETTPGLKDEYMFCPRCGWNVHKSYTPYELTEKDKIQFVYSIMQRVPFEKTFELFQGQMKVTFRSKTTEDDALIMMQLRRDLDEELYGDPSTVTFYSNLYELALILVKIDGPTPAGMKAVIKPDYKEYADKKNGLREFTRHLTKDYIGTEALLRLVSEHYRTFTTMYKALVDEAVKENFYSPA